MKNILNTLAFYAQNNQNWHSFNTDRATINAVKSLDERGYLMVDWINKQAKFNKNGIKV